MNYSISYNLRKSGRGTKARVDARLRSMGAVRCLDTGWLLTSQQTVKAIAECLRREMSPDDTLLVTEIVDAAWQKLQNPSQCEALLKPHPTRGIAL